MKKIMISLVAMMMALGVSAQHKSTSSTPFNEGKWMVGMSASGLDLSWHKGEKWNIDLEAKAGYLFIDNWMVLAKLAYNNSTYGKSSFGLGANLRYYVEQNGIYVGAGLDFRHAHGLDDFLPEVNVGYAFFVSHHVTIEPELYYELSTKCSDYSGLGIRIGASYYF